MPAAINLIGHKYGRLTVIEEGDRLRVSRRKVLRRWVCVCDCGNTSILSTGNIRSGNSKSCGCLNLELIAERGRRLNRTHGYRNTSIYHTWSSMVQRCTNPKAQAWRNYGGRGISVCERWLKFENFLADMGERPAGLDLDRINNDGNYELGNCRWTTRSVNIKNTRPRQRDSLGRYTST